MLRQTIPRQPRFTCRHRMPRGRIFASSAGTRRWCILQVRPCTTKSQIQKRWGDVGDLLHLQYDMTTGSHMQRRGGASIRKVIDLKAAQSRSKGRSTASSWRVWTEFKDVAHLVAATVLLLTEAKMRIERERWPAQLSAYRIVMLAPEAVLAVGKFFEQ